MSNKTEEARAKPTAKPALVPKLRFPEFRDAGEWEEKRLSSMVGLVSGLHLSPEEYSKEGEVPYFTGPSDFTNRTQEVLKWTGESTSIAKGNDTLITVKGSGVGEVWYLTLPAVAMGRQLMAVRTINGSNRFIFQFLLTKKTRFEDLASGNLIPGLSRGDILDLEARFPSLLEQQKIADCLSSIDELITLETQKIDALKDHKKGLMQQLFPAEGETLPKLRFPEFRDAREWEEKKAGTLFANRVEDGEEGFPIYSVTMNDGMIKRSSLERRVDDIAEASGNRKALKGDIVYNMMRMWQGAFGVSKEDCMVSPAYVVLSPKSSTCSDFFWYLFKLPKYLYLLTSHSQGLTLDRLRLYYKDFANIRVLIPSLPEQQKIADCLSSIDDLIALQTQKLDALKTHKKGLMQQLFPVSGEVRK